MIRWVQHKSGQGEKWEVAKEHLASYSVHRRSCRVDLLILPKEEYVLCEPGEEWEDVTADCFDRDGFIYHNHNFGTKWCYSEHGFRIRKIDGMHNGPAFVVERKKP